MKKTLVVATTKPGKLAEITLAMAGYGYELVPWPAVAKGHALPESGTSMRENAVQKAVAAAEYTGTMALADDTGLVVHAMGGRPGVHAARWAGPAASAGLRNRLLLTLLAPVPFEARTAEFRCVACVAWPGGRVVTASGVLPGFILQEPQGAQGFGYDPLFWLPDRGCTLAELDSAEKNAVSHRGQALRALFAQLTAMEIAAGGE